MKNLSTKMLVEAGVMIALAQILSYIKIFEAPYGGSVTAASMVPIIVYSIRWGIKPGLLVGVVYGILQFILGPKYSYHILSILFDYIVAFGVLGLSGLLRKSTKGMFLGVFLGIFLRFISHVISGAIVWGIYAPEGTNPWIYSIIYNGSYLLPELIISYIVFGFIYRPIKNLATS
ncbi:thiamine transporter [Alkalithermobacter thermoalcaliphilus JW-YL-7 = DSM 7308]|uniref:Thiamine transporter n=1 Tax=Alkalithermobacter thermoalcaliphilus JW-YL-7 = DSM 7308 TaxID=1121328 RepID=A0A150FR86_CLOPD|nr:proton-coupled thiamine transporter YuaJ [[Clostridium] paradoxum JW-YL-7 = DSM 7308]SHL02626.1 thiamine transporter [[Clostridium] paradoxum JW-YL-7 = DSM 7308]